MLLIAESPSSAQTASSSPEGAPETPTAPTHAEISDRARRIWIENGRKAGTALSDWLQAEKELSEARGLQLS